jgi:hypothetical protein
VPKYRAIEQPVTIKSSYSDLVALTWLDRSIAADFIIPGDDQQVLRVHFDATHIVRILDEMPLSTENEDTRPEGLVPDHFAYIVEGSLFWKSQSDAFKTLFNKAQHYRFVTGWTCLDVISDVGPTMSAIQKNPSPIGKS